FSSRRRHTRSYGDWSSDVCSSDLVPGNHVEAVELQAEPVVARAERLLVEEVADVARVVVARDEDDVLALDARELVARVGVLLRRSEERRVGKGCRCRWAADW